MSQDEAVSEGSVGGVKAAVSGLFGKLCSVDPRLWAVICLLGFLMMLFGTLLFVFAPEEAYEAIFIVGVVLLVLGYALLFLGNARVRSEAEARWLLVEHRRCDHRGPHQEVTKCQRSTPTYSTCSSTRPT